MGILYNKEIFMNKNYSNLLMMAIVSLVFHSGSLALERSGTACSDINKNNNWKRAVGQYILRHFAMYCGATGVSMNFIKVISRKDCQINFLEKKDETI